MAKESTNRYARILARALRAGMPVDYNTTIGQATNYLTNYLRAGKRIPNVALPPQQQALVRIIERAANRGMNLGTGTNIGQASNFIKTAMNVEKELGRVKKGISNIASGIIAKAPEERKPKLTEKITKTLENVGITSNLPKPPAPKPSATGTTGGTTETTGGATKEESLTPETVKELESNTTLPEVPDQQTEASKAVNNASANASAVLGTMDYWENKLKELEDKIATEQKETKGWLAKLTAKPEKTMEERLAEARKAAGIPEITADMSAQRMKIAALQEDINKLDAQHAADVEKVRSLGIAVPYQEAKIAELNRVYNRDKAYKAAELNANAAVLQAMAGNLSEAKSLADEAVKAYTYDQEQERRRLEYIFTYHNDFVKSLKSEYRNILSDALDTARLNEQATREAKSYVLKLMTDPNLVKAGIKITDTPEEAARKAKDYLAGLPEEADKTDVMNLMLKYPKAGITLEDTIEEATKKASKWEAEQPAEYKAPVTKLIGNKLYAWDATTGKFVDTGITSESASNYQIVTDNEGKMWRVNKLTGEKKELGITGKTQEVMSQSVLNKLAAKGVPNDVALTMQEDLNNGHSFDEIYEGMKQSGIEPLVAGKYIDTFREVMASQGMVVLQNITLPNEYQERAKKEMETAGETTGGEATGGKGFVWYNPSTWRNIKFPWSK